MFDSGSNTTETTGPLLCKFTSHIIRFNANVCFGTRQFSTSNKKNSPTNTRFDNSEVVCLLRCTHHHVLQNKSTKISARLATIARSTRVCLSHNVLLHFGGGMEEVHKVT
jgi:hypothetical protein